MTDKTKTLAEALLEAQAAIENPKKNATNPAYKSKYADLEEILNVVKPVLNAEGIILLQPPVSTDEGVGVHTILVGHGETLDLGQYVLPLAKRDPQGAGGAITYARRYALAAIFGLAQEDDDGNAASNVKPDAGRSYGSSGTSKAASEAQVRAIWGKAKTLGMSAKAVEAACVRDTEGRADHPDKLTAGDAKVMLDKMQAAIDAKKEPPAPTEGPLAETFPAEDLTNASEVPF